ncbi:MFS transporter [Hydrogenivirga sp. 128-5-R1-1]|uniref:MFS transporter n=1 Tax=Hydrogenivirga sp. 128-5-R1-1 TaxID=392423 RepID=UPI00015F0C10|nr:MFS transporter [Hydrogenivirga sp. 128-5-R1-1]EDP75810.1 GTP-binding protein LepA [Hydrogenivirga sp. 128-5-R1-1]
MERGRAYRLVVLLGIVSLLSDVVYEGARSVVGSYLSVLGAGSVVTGLVAGGGEFFGYSLRLLFGYLADRTRAYWFLTMSGYALTLFSVPLMGLVKSWMWVAGLLLTERLGKAIRTPSRDAILSFATQKVGYGKGFGIHEFLDQVGAVLGPLLVAVVLSLSSDYRVTFLSLLFPSVFAMLLLLKAKGEFLEPKAVTEEVKSPRSVFYLYLVGSSLLSLGFVQFPLVAFHWRENDLMSDPSIPLAFSAAMLLDALSALAFGFLFDRIGMYALSIGVLAGVPATFLLFKGDSSALYLGIALWGISLGVQESIMRSAIAKLTRREERGRAYGLFHFFLGVSIFLGNALMGFLYSAGVLYVVVYSTLLQLLSIPLFLICQRRLQE